MRLLLVSNLFPPDVQGGYELLAAQAADELRRRGHEVRVLTSAHGPHSSADGVARDLLLTDLGDGYVAGHTPADVRVVDELRARSLNASNARVLLRHLGEFRPDVVLLWNLDGIGGLSLVTLLQLRSVPWVWLLSDCVPRVLTAVRGRVLSPLAAAVPLVASGTYIACSRGVVEEIEQAGVSVGPELHVVPNWVTLQPPPPPPGRREGPLRLSFASRVTVEKGAQVAVETVARCRRAGLEVHLDVYGEVTDLRIPMEAGRLGVEDAVTFHGWTDPDALLATHPHHDLLLFPTWPREPFGLVPIEALSMGCVPVVAADCGVSEWLVDGVHCLKARPTSERFAQVVARVAAGDVDLDAIRTAGMRLARNEYGVRAVFDRVEPILAARAAQPAARPPVAEADSVRLLSVVERVGLATAGASIAGRRGAARG